MNSRRMKYINHIITIILLACMAGFAAYGIKAGLFTNKEQLQFFISQSGIWGPAFFILIQILQVVFPIIPGGVTCMAGVILFDPYLGFLYSYIGIIVGSSINFYLARRYGETFVRKFVEDATYYKYMDKLNRGNKFDIVFAAAIILPGAPDDILCMLAGLTRMTWQKFACILLLGRPASLIFYSAAGILI